MDLWVRSQSKRTLIKAEKIFTEGEEVYATTNSEFNERIGIYKTKERALEVLDEIQDLFISRETFKTEFTKDGLTLMNKQPSSVVYKMPQE